MSIFEEFSVAAVVYYDEEYLLLKYGLGHWEFVKGHKEENETDEQTILRELREETGIINASLINGFKKNYNYYFTQKNKNIHKFVACYLIQAKEKQVSLSFEHVDFVWLPFRRALKRLTYKNAKIILEKAHNFRKSPLSPFL
ncbi:MAG: bis(5'-nucleosyl)-tetraphosphatase [Candidatus Hermodarchaeota archaeon]